MRAERRISVLSSTTHDAPVGTGPPGVIFQIVPSGELILPDDYRKVNRTGGVPSRPDLAPTEGRAECSNWVKLRTQMFNF